MAIWTGALLAEEGLAEPAALTRRVLGQIHAEGFERTMDAWLRRLEPRLAADDAFSRERGRQFTAAAGRFDATGRREVAEFIAFMERHTMRDTDTAAVLRVMTEPEIVIDFKPAHTVVQLVQKLGNCQRNFLAEARSRWRLSAAAFLRSARILAK